MKKLVLVGLSVLSLSAFSTSAFAEQTVVVNGGSYTCTSSCAINGDGNSIVITDCCGGTVNGMSFVRISLNHMQF